MSNKLSDETITALYQQGATQSPSSELDQAILRHAAAELESDTAVKRAGKPIKLRYRAWFTPISAVASMVCVALLYWQNANVFHQTSQVINDGAVKERPEASKRLNQQHQPDSELREEAKISLDTIQFNVPAPISDEPQMLKKEQVLRPALSDPPYKSTQSPPFEVLSLSSEDEQSLAEVDKLLAENKPMQAAERLKAVLKDAPYLTEHLSAQQQQLLHEPKRP